MSSHSVKLAEALRKFRDIQCLHSENIYNEYNRGLYNGLELAWSIMNNKKPVYAMKSDKIKRGQTKKAEDNEEPIQTKT